MSRIITVWIMIFGVFSAFSQENVNQTVYSESTPYQPREFRDSKNNLVDAHGDRIRKKKENSNVSQVNNLSSPSLSKIFTFPLFVKDKNGDPVLDLKIEDLRLFINGEEFSIESLVEKDFSSSIILLLDISNSTDGENLTDLKRLASQLVERLTPQFKVKLITFDQKVKVHTEFVSDKFQLLQIIEKIKNGGGTSLYDSLAYVLKKETVPGTKVLLLTDGVDSASEKYSYEDSLLLAEQSESEIFPFRFDTSLGLLNDNGVFRSSIPGVLSMPPGIRIIGLTPASIKAIYERGGKYLFDLGAVSGGRGIGIKNNARLTDNEVDYLASSIIPQNYFSFKLSKVPKTPIERKQIRLRVNRPNLLIQTRGSLRF